MQSLLQLHVVGVVRRLVDYEFTQVYCVFMSGVCGHLGHENENGGLVG